MTRAIIDSDSVLWSIPGKERAKRLPETALVILMHGYASDERDLHDLFNHLPEQFVYASLRAPLTPPPPLDRAFAWFQLGDPGNPDPDQANAAALGVLDWLDEVEELYGTPAKVGTMGFSQGGAMSIQVLRAAPERITSAVNLSGFSVSGEVSGDSTLAQIRPPVFWGRDEADPVIPASAIDRTTAWLPTHSTLTTLLYEGIRHGISGKEIDDVSRFLTATLGVSAADELTTEG